MSWFSRRDTGAWPSSLWRLRTSHGLTRHIPFRTRWKLWWLRGAWCSSSASWKVRYVICEPDSGKHADKMDTATKLVSCLDGSGGLCCFWRLQPHYFSCLPPDTRSPSLALLYQKVCWPHIPLTLLLANPPTVFGRSSSLRWPVFSHPPLRSPLTRHSTRRTRFRGPTSCATPSSRRSTTSSTTCHRPTSRSTACIRGTSICW